VDSDALLLYTNTFDSTAELTHNRISSDEAFKHIIAHISEQSEVEVQKPTEAHETSTAATLSNVNLVWCVSPGFKSTHHQRKKYEVMAVE
jgi:hypothetical protein